MVVIGIDLGTTHSCVAVFENGKTEVLENYHANRTTPSFVAFTEVDLIIGEEAKKESVIHPSNCVFDSKRLIGRSFDDPHTQEDIKHWPFTVINDNGKPMIEVEYLQQRERFTPEQISSIILQKLKESTEDKLGKKVTGAVITVPAYFNDNQRQATKNAASKAGLNVLRLLNEPTAAAIAFASEKENLKKSNVLVYDLGGGTFDVSVLCIENGDIKVVAVNGDTHLGGNDIDNILLDYFLDEINKNFDRDLRAEGKIKSIAKLRRSCEDTKISLSAKNRKQASIIVDALYDGKDFKSVITRTEFDNICDELMRKTLVPIEKALEDARLNREDIDEVLMIGGSTRNLKIQELVKEFFDGKPLNNKFNPEEAVARGAAIQAALLEDNLCGADMNLMDVTPLSYGIKLVDGSMSIIIPRNTPYPTSRTHIYSTTYDYQTSVLISVYQGEHKFVKDNCFLGHFSLRNLPKKKEGEVDIDTTIEIDENGILVVTAVESSTGLSANITITKFDEILPENTIKAMISEIKLMEKESKLIEPEEVKKELRNKINKLNDILNKNYIDLYCGSKIRQRVEKFVSEVEEWFDYCPNANIEEIYEKLQLLKCHCLILISTSENCRTS